MRRDVLIMCVSTGRSAGVIVAGVPQSIRADVAISTLASEANLLFCLKDW